MTARVAGCKLASGAAASCLHVTPCSRSCSVVWRSAPALSCCNIGCRAAGCRLTPGRILSLSLRRRRRRLRRMRRCHADVELRGRQDRAGLEAQLAHATRCRAASSVHAQHPSQTPAPGNAPAAGAAHQRWTPCRSMPGGRLPASRTPAPSAGGQPERPPPSRQPCRCRPPAWAGKRGGRASGRQAGTMARAAAGGAACLAAALALAQAPDAGLVVLPARVGGCKVANANVECLCVARCAGRGQSMRHHAGATPDSPPPPPSPSTFTTQ